jgi:hypothetical protein
LVCGLFKLRFIFPLIDRRSVFVFIPLTLTPAPQPNSSGFAKAGVYFA